MDLSIEEPTTNLLTHAGTKIFEIFFFKHICCWKSWMFFVTVYRTILQVNVFTSVNLLVIFSDTMHFSKISLFF